MNTCIDAFKSLNIADYNGTIWVSPCCVSPVKKSLTTDFKKIFYLNDIRNSWSQGVFPSACNACKIAEEEKINSRRLGANQWYADNGFTDTEVELIRLDYWVGDTCNLRCAICFPLCSSAWKQELNVSSKLKKVVTNNFWKKMDLTTLRWVHFNGGEPLLSKNHVEFLEALPNKHLIYVSYNTNGTILPDQNLLNLWSQFKLVQLDFSIDDIEQRFEYQRYPANWNTVTNNLQWYIENSPHNCMFAVNTTVSILNQSNLDNLNLWLEKNFYVSRFTDRIQHRKQLAIGVFAIEAANTRVADAQRFLNSCDARRGTNWRTVFPELIDWFDQDKLR